MKANERNTQQDNNITSINTKEPDDTYNMEDYNKHDTLQEVQRSIRILRKLWAGFNKIHLEIPKHMSHRNTDCMYTLTLFNTIRQTSGMSTAKKQLR